MSKTYSVEVKRTQFLTIEITANSAKEAEEMALDECWERDDWETWDEQASAIPVEGQE